MANKITRRRLIKFIALIPLGIIAIVVFPFIKKIIQLFGSTVNSDVKPPDKTLEFYFGTVDNKGKKNNKRHQEVEYFTIDLNGVGVYLEMMSITRDSFLMGSPHNELGRSKDEALSDGKQLDVTVKPFYIGRYPVTQAQWEEVAKLPTVKLSLDHKPSTFHENTRDANLPVETVSWEEANEFCERLTQTFGGKYRLPSEAEWEYACRGKTKTPFYFGDTITPDLANYDVFYSYGDERPKESKYTKGKYRGKTILVNEIQAPNYFGLESVHGNVWEWCADSYHDNYDKTPKDGSPWQDNNSQRRVIRGGAWHSFPTGCRSASRNYKPQTMKSNAIGFRVVYVES